MGAFFSYMLSFVTPVDTTPDPVTGLTERDRQVITETWGLVSEKHAIKQNGVAFFIALFKAHPHMQDYFPLFRGRPHDELLTCPKMRAHATSVMYALQSYIGTLDDAETLAGLVTKIATSHVPRGIGGDDVEKLSVVFVDFMAAGLKAKWTPEAASAWTQLLKVQAIIWRQIEEQIAAGDKK